MDFKSLEFCVQVHTTIVVVNNNSGVINIPLIKFVNREINDVGLWHIKLR